MISVHPDHLIPILQYASFNYSEFMFPLRITPEKVISKWSKNMQDRTVRSVLWLHNNLEIKSFFDALNRAVNF